MAQPSVLDHIKPILKPYKTILNPYFSPTLGLVRVLGRNMSQKVESCNPNGPKDDENRVEDWIFPCLGPPINGGYSSVSISIDWRYIIHTIYIYIQTYIYIYRHIYIYTHTYVFPYQHEETISTPSF